MNLVPVSYKIIYNNKDITRDISDHILSVSYMDKVQGEADEIEITVEDKDGLWQNDWYPDKKDTLEVFFDDNGLQLPCGKFSIDEIKLSSSRGDGDVVSISGIAASITKKMRTKKSTPHENKTLKQLAQFVADQHGLTVQGTIPDIRFSRITQNKETDLSFLNRLADMYGLVFSVRDTLLVFQDREELENKNHIISIDKTDCMSYEFTDKSDKTYASAMVQYHDPVKNELVTAEYIPPPVQVGSTIGFSQLNVGAVFIPATVTTDADIQSAIQGLGVISPYYKNVSLDALKLYGKAENRQQAERIAKSGLNKKNSKESTTSISLPGNVLLVSGVNMELTGFGKMSGIYQVTESKHSLNRGDGYTSTVEAKKVNAVSPAKYKPKVKKVNSPRGVLSASVGQTIPSGTVIRRLGGGTKIVQD